jgi:hypothetical protein
VSARPQRGVRHAGDVASGGPPARQEATELQVSCFTFAPRPSQEVEPVPASTGRGASPKNAGNAKPVKKSRGQTIDLPDDLFERIIVQAHRRGKTISESVKRILGRQVPDYRTIRTDVGD